MRRGMYSRNCFILMGSLFKFQIICVILNYLKVSVCFVNQRIINVIISRRLNNLELLFDYEKIRSKIGKLVDLILDSYPNELVHPT